MDALRSVSGFSLMWIKTELEIRPSEGDKCVLSCVLYIRYSYFTYDTGTVYCILCVGLDYSEKV